MKWQALAAAAVLVFATTSHAAEKKYGTGVPGTEIRLGQTPPFSDAVLAYRAIPKVRVAHLKMINDRCGVNGRKIELISLA